MIWTHRSPLGEVVFFNTCIADYSFTHVPSGADWNPSAGDTSLVANVAFGGTLSPNDLTSVTLLAQDSVIPNMSFGLLQLSGSTNGALSISDSTSLSSDANGLFVPEPSSALVLLMGLGGACLIRKR